MINELLFVYGSLLNTDNEFANYLNSNALIYGTGKIKGVLYDIGEYPGAVIAAEGYIFGTIFKLNNADGALKILDDYEGFGSGQEQPNLFVRELMPVETGTFVINCWVYLYNRPVKGLPQIPSGDYLAYLDQKKH